jgi:hypothetical protein
MNTTPSSPARFSDHDLPTVGEVQPFRPSGLVALLLGLLSFLAVFASSLLLVPLAAVLIGLFALRPARPGQGQPAGRTPAMVGILLALFFSAWSVIYFQSRHTLLAESASEFAANWLELLIRGEREAAYELTKLASQRQIEGVSLREYYSPANSKAFESIDAFMSQRPVAAVLDAGTNADWQYVETRQVIMRGQQELIYTVFVDANGVAPVIEVIMGRIAPGLIPPPEPRTRDEKQAAQQAAARGELPPQPAQWIVYGVQFSPEQTRAAEDAFAANGSREI